jgi:hypothetical protein
MDFDPFDWSIAGIIDAAQASDPKFQSLNFQLVSYRAAEPENTRPPEITSPAWGSEAIADIGWDKRFEMCSSLKDLGTAGAEFSNAYRTSYAKFSFLISVVQSLDWPYVILLGTISLASIAAWMWFIVVHRIPEYCLLIAQGFRLKQIRRMLYAQTILVGVVSLLVASLILVGVGFVMEQDFSRLLSGAQGIARACKVDLDGSVDMISLTARDVFSWVGCIWGAGLILACGLGRIWLRVLHITAHGDIGERI